MNILLVDVIARLLTDAGIPISGVSVGDPAVRSTWRIFYQASATPAQRTQGDALLLTLDPQDPTALTEIKADLSSVKAGDELIRAIVQGLYECAQAPLTFPTLASLRTRILVIYRGLL